MICSPYGGAMTKILWNSMEPFTPFTALEKRFCQIPNGKRIEKMAIWPLFFLFFLMPRWKKSVFATPYSYLVVSARFKVCIMAKFCTYVLFLKKDWFSLLKWKGSLSFSPLLSSIWWLYDPVTLSVPMSINFMIKSISMLVLLQIKVTHFAQSCTNSQKTLKIHPINAEYTPYTPIFQ